MEDTIVKIRVNADGSHAGNPTNSDVSMNFSKKLSSSHILYFSTKLANLCKQYIECILSFFLEVGVCWKKVSAIFL